MASLRGVGLPDEMNSSVLRKLVAVEAEALRAPAMRWVAAFQLYGVDVRRRCSL